MSEVLITTSGVAVTPDNELQPMKTCPIGCKVQLLNLGGVLIYGMISENTRNEYLAWYGLPRRPKWLVELMSPTRKNI